MTTEPETLSLILVRHTRTDDNDEKVYSAQHDPPLNAQGVRQAIALAEALATRPISRIYTSDQRRARTVAELIGAHHRRAAFEPTNALRELNMGKLAGHTKTSLSECHPDPQFRTSDPAYDFRFVGGESRFEVVARQAGLLMVTILLHQLGHRPLATGTEIIFVGHGTSLRGLLETMGAPEALHPQGGYTEVELTLLSGGYRLNAATVRKV